MAEPETDVHHLAYSQAVEASPGTDRLIHRSAPNQDGARRGRSRFRPAVPGSLFSGRQNWLAIQKHRLRFRVSPFIHQNLSRANADNSQFSNGAGWPVDNDGLAQQRDR